MILQRKQQDFDVKDQGKLSCEFSRIRRWQGFSMRQFFQIISSQVSYSSYVHFTVYWLFQDGNAFWQNNNFIELVLSPNPFWPSFFPDTEYNYTIPTGSGHSHSHSHEDEDDGKDDGEAHQQKTKLKRTNSNNVKLGLTVILSSAVDDDLWNVEMKDTTVNNYDGFKVTSSIM